MKIRFLAALAALLLGSAVWASEPLGVFAAASLTDVLPKVAKLWKEKSHIDITLGFEASSKLSKQISEGAAADVFISADADWMDELEKKGFLEPKTRINLLSNRLVFILPVDSKLQAKSPGAISGVEFQHLALAGETVPAGKYGRAALGSAGLLESVRSRIVSGGNVRTALEWVARKEAEGGIVYESDAMAEPRVKIAFYFPQSSYPPIIYPIAAIRHSRANKSALAVAQDFIRFCQSKPAQSLFKAAGFISTKQ